MPLNPALHDEVLTSPIERSNTLNDPKQFVVQGYNTFDFTNQRALSARFGEYTPFDVFEVLPGDRHMLGDDSLSLLNTIDASLVSKVNEYHDYFYVPMRSIFPYNYEKIIANPTKGSDLPATALPMVPVLHLFDRLLSAEQVFEFEGSNYSIAPGFKSGVPLNDNPSYEILLNNLLYASFALSRGQLLDYIGFGLDDITSTSSLDAVGIPTYQNVIQYLIEGIWNGLLGGSTTVDTDEGSIQVINIRRKPGVHGYDLNRLSTNTSGDLVWPSGGSLPSVSYSPSYELDAENPDRVASDSWRLDAFRDAVYDCLEKGLFIRFDFDRAIGLADLTGYEAFPSDLLLECSRNFMRYLSNFVLPGDSSNASPEDLFDRGFINPMRLVAYQQIIAEYGSNDSIDSIFTSDLWMQNMRSIMFPRGVDGTTREPTFLYNGVSYEYDLFTTGSWEYAFWNSSDLLFNKLLPFISNLFFLRRSLRYGDYFATGRPDFLSVGQLGINAESGMVDPVEVVQQQLKARYLQATNWLGSRFDAQMAGIFNTDPSDTEAKPYFISHRKIELGAQEVNGTASDNQGKRVTNLIGSSGQGGIDIYTDDFGVVFGLLSYDVLPLYPSGVDRNLRNYDRFSMYNAMLQNVGDQDISLDELTGDVTLQSTTFAYTTRYGQYKFPINRAHGAFVSSSGSPMVPVAAMIYPARQYMNDGNTVFHISPEFIRDRPFYFDQFYASSSNLSPAYYYHFAFSVTNQHAAARRMQLIPQLLF